MRARLAELAARPSLRVGAAAVTVVLLAVGAWEAWLVWRVALASGNHPIGLDLSYYLDATRSWLAGNGYYLPRQLTGEPYTIQVGDVLYPPPTILLFLPWALGAPLVLWWAIPLGLIAAAIVGLRPTVFAWPILAWALTDTRTWAMLVYGNPSMWAIAAVAAGSAWGWPAVGSLVKPVFWPFTLLGFRRRDHRRRTAIALGAMLAIGAAFLPLWHDWVTVVTSASTPDGPEWVFGEVPVGIAVAAALWRRRSPPPAAELRGDW